MQDHICYPSALREGNYLPVPIRERPGHQPITLPVVTLPMTYGIYSYSGTCHAEIGALFLNEQVKWQKGVTN
jgi:hypothetical protein